VARAGRRLEQLGGALRAHAPKARLAARRARLDTLSRALEREGAHALALRRERLAALAGHLDALSPLAVLGRGYAIARLPSGEVLRRARDVAPGDAFTVRLGEGEVDATAARIRAPRSGRAGGGD
jgi:exodeoxyribonuclease VII large subunit